ncbi:MAG: transposase, partial [bacterium]|nr:transposase [bacterium]
MLVDKFADHLPLRRQQKRFRRDKILIPIANLCRMVQHSANLLKHVVDQMKKEMLAGTLIQTDETGIPILHGPKNKPKKGVLWVYTNAEHAVFEVTDSKEGRHSAKFLQGFEGVLLPDGASVFNASCLAEGVTRAGCWSHARRKFFDARERDPRAL